MILEMPWESGSPEASPLGAHASGCQTPCPIASAWGLSWILCESWVRCPSVFMNESGVISLVQKPFSIFNGASSKGVN